MNAALGNVGTTVVYTQTPQANPGDGMAALRDLVGEMNAGTVAVLVVLGANPVFTAPADLKFAAAMGKVPLTRPSRAAPRRDRRCTASGTSPRRTTSRRGATPAPATAP